MVNQDLNNILSRLNKEGTYGAYNAAASAVERLNAEESGLTPLKVAVLRNFTFEPLLPVIKGEMIKAGFYPEVYVGEYDTIVQDALNPQSPLYQFAPDVILVAQWLDSSAPSLTEKFLSLSADERDEEVQRVLNTTTDILTALRRNSSAPVLINNFPLPAWVTLGVLDAQSPEYQTGTFLKLNTELLERVRQVKDVYMVDYMRLMAGIGYAQGVDERYWHIGRAPFGQNALVPFGREYGKLIVAIRGKARKCLVLDCDNVLWGGILGEDGLEGIKLGTDFPGSCYQALQKEILNLHDRGVILALCSKNNEGDVLEVLRTHPAMVLREEHLSTWRVNWEDKVTNILSIAEDLNIGLDSIVFADDSPFECDLVRERLPEVAVLQLSDHQALFKTKLSEKGYFDSLVFSGEDKKRNQMYRDEGKRKDLYKASGSLEEYFQKLDMEAQIGLADETSIQRIAQLTQKTNQFNLTTRRYSEGDIKALAQSPEADVFYISLRDRIADMGLIGVAILKYSDKQAEIDTFLLSCRVIGRGVEEALLSHAAKAAMSRGCERITGSYRVTKKNEQVADFYRRTGFRLIAEDDKGSDWEMFFDKETRLPAEPQWIKVNVQKAKEERCTAKKH